MKIKSKEDKNGSKQCIFNNIISFMFSASSIFDNWKHKITIYC